jgi:hypothetical protein
MELAPFLTAIVDGETMRRLRPGLYRSIEEIRLSGGYTFANSDGFGQERVQMLETEAGPRFVFR